MPSNGFWWKTCIEITFFQWSQPVVSLPYGNDLGKPAWTYYFIVKFHCGLSRSNCPVSARSYVKCLLFNVNHTGQIDQDINHVEFDANFSPQVYLENNKSSVGAEDSHYYNIFFWECNSDRKCHWHLPSLLVKENNMNNAMSFYQWPRITNIACKFYLM